MLGTGRARPEGPNLWLPGQPPWMGGSVARLEPWHRGLVYPRPKVLFTFNREL